MLKKPGGGAFKPKAPMARRRPAANLPTPSATPAEGNEELPKTVSVQDASVGSAPDVVTPSKAAAPTIQQQETSDTNTASDKNLANDPSARASNTETSSTPQSTSVTPAAEIPSVTLSKGPPIAQAVIEHTLQRPEEPTTSSTAARASITPSEPEAEADRATRDTLPNTETNKSTTQVIADTETPPSASDREVEALPTPPATSAVTTAAAVENSETPPSELTNTAAKPTESAAAKSRKRKAHANGGESEAETGAETGVDTGAETDRPAKKRRASRKKTAATNTDGAVQTNDAESSGSARSRARQPRKKNTTLRGRRNTDQAEGDNADGTENEGSQQEVAVKRTKRRRRRSSTPEDAQELTIDPETWTIAQLTKDLKMGKRWDRAKDVETAERNRKRELQRQRLIKLGLLQEGEELPAGDMSEAGTPAPEAAPPAREPTPPPPAPAPAPAPAPGGISMRIDANGNIIVDESSLQHDRHREADLNRGALLVQEENEFSKRTTHQTYMRRQPKANAWTMEDTEKFYHGLRMFGTDFNMISKLFGGAKDRRQVKLKFNREERAHPVAVNKCLIGEKVVPMDLEEIEGADGLEDSQTINDELARLREEREAEARQVEEEIAAEARRKREELFGKKKGKNHHLQEQHDDEGGNTNNDGEPGAADDADGNNATATTTTATTTTNSRGGRQRSERSQPHQEHPGAKYGVGTDPDVIDETDLPATSSSTGRGGGRGSRGGRGGRRGGKAVFASGFGV